MNRPTRHLPGFCFILRKQYYLLVCLILTGFYIPSFAQITVSFEIDLPTCNDYSNGNITAFPEGGVAPYSFFWSNLQAGQTSYGVTAGLYSVTIFDANLSMITAEVTIEEPDLLEINIEQLYDVCDYSAGTLIANVNGGTPPYSYLWNTEATTDTISNLDFEFYLVTITDANNCKAIMGAIVPNPLNVEVQANDIICNGMSDGSAEALVSGGISPYSYSWEIDTGDSVYVIEDEFILNMLPASTYTVTVTDGNGCTAAGMGEINEPPPILLNIEIDDPCNGNANVVVNASGGVPPLAYEWGHGPTTPDLMGLVEGNYFLTVTDGNDCKVDTIIMISDGIEIVVDTVDANCMGANNGLATIEVTNGIEPLAYIWSHGADSTSNVASNLSPGDYAVTVIDGANCTDTITFEIGSNFDSLYIETIATSTCDSACVGTASVSSILGGFPPFTFQWDAQTGNQTSQTAENLCVGFYEIIVTDSLSCVAIDTVEILETAPFMVEVEVENATCNDAENGTAVAHVINGVPPFSFEWSNGQTGSMAMNLLPGNYTVTVSDSLGCQQIIDTIQIDYNSFVDAQFNWEIENCVGDSILINFNDASTWSPLQDSITQWDWTLSSGDTSDLDSFQVYLNESPVEATLIVLNAAGCRDTLIDTLEFSILSCEIAFSDSTICLGEDLELSINCNLPDTTLIFDWSPDSLIANGDGTNAVNLNFIASGDYNFTVNIADTMGCVLEDSIYVSVLDTTALVDTSLISFTQSCDTFEICIINENDSLSFSNYAWYFDYPDNLIFSNDQNPCFQYPDTGSYTIALVSENPCHDTLFFPVVVEPIPEANFILEIQSCSDTVEVNFTDISTPEIEITSWLWNFGNGMNSDIPDPNIFITDSTQILNVILEIEFENGCVKTADSLAIVRIFNPKNPKDTIVSCDPGLPIYINPEGDSTLNYVWSPDNGTLDDINGWNPLSSTSEEILYSVVLDSLGECFVERTVQILFANPLNLTVSEDLEFCEEMPDTLFANTNIPASYVWSNFPDFSDTLMIDDGATYSEMEILVTDSTSYFVMVTDEFGCSQMEEIVVGSYEVGLIIPMNNEVCDGAEVEIEVLGLEADDIFIWTPFDPNGLILEDTATFKYEISNSHGCSMDGEITINVIKVSDILEILPESDTIVIGQSVEIEATEINGFYYNWTPNDFLDFDNIHDPISTPSESITYTLEIENDLGCRGSGTVSICVVNDLCDFPMIFVPNGFTPNGDGLNDVLFVQGTNIDEMVFAIFNRWGEKVFESRAIEDGWDGRHQSKRASGDVFAYYLEVKCISGGSYFKKGNITLIR